jgi:AMP-polyphosphate phosphotransferase
VPSLADADLSLKLSKAEEAERLDAAQERLLRARLELGGQFGGPLGPGVCVLFEGWDASGKGGAIKRVTERLDPRHVRVATFAAPTADEKRHHFMHRFAPALPGHGGLAVLDRTWYGRVLVERVEGFATPDEWERAYGQIVHAEAGLHAEGVRIVKFWMHISDAEQLKRFEARRDDPLKSWKLTDEDWRNREKRPAYEAAVQDMLERTSQDVAPWTVVPGESKRYARVFVVEHVAGVLERALTERR